MHRFESAVVRLWCTLLAVAVVVSGCEGLSQADAESDRTIRNLPTIAWEGGSEYWRQFANASEWTSPEFFPIGLWYGSFDDAAQVQWDQHLGINFYTGGLWKESDFKVLESTGMYWVGGKVNDGFDSGSKNWPGRLTDDEVDGRFPDPAQGRAHLQEIEDGLRGHGQFLYGNYTQMVVGPDLAISDQEKYVNDYTDVVSLDNYLYTNSVCDYDPYRGDLYVNPIPQNTCRTASSYGRMTGSLRTRDASDGRLQPVWNFIELITGIGDEKSFVREIAPAELKGAAIASIINEARGIVWFPQALGGECLTTQPLRNAQEQGAHFCGKDQVSAMGEVNNLIKSFAAVLNTQSYQWSFGEGTDTMLKVKDGNAYLFAMTDGGVGERTFTVPAGLSSAVEVVGEDRILRTHGGAFKDSFEEESAYHIYRFSLD